MKSYREMMIDSLVYHTARGDIFQAEYYGRQVQESIANNKNHNYRAYEGASVAQKSLIIGPTLEFLL